MQRLVCLLLLLFAPMRAFAAAFDPQPWLADLAQVRTAVDERYANRDWLVGERAVDLDALFARARTRIEAAQSEADARLAFERLVRRVDDGHVELSWPAHGGGPGGAPPALCQRLGYDASLSSAGRALHLPSYAPLPAGGHVIPAGIVQAGGTRLGVIRIGVFEPQGMPALCEAAAAARHLPSTAHCDDACSDAILTAGYRHLTADLGSRLAELRRAGAGVLLLDLTDNGGGSEWAEAVARMLTPRPLAAAPIGFVRSAAWARSWRDLAAKLRTAAATAAPADRARLANWAREADTAAAVAARPCAPTSCPALPRAGYATGLVASAPAGSFDGKSWGPLVFTPAQYGYRDGAWSGPLIVLVDGETWSAAEEVAAELQDAHAAIIMGGRTGGAGCGHASGEGPLVLAHSGGSLTLPDCARYRADGSNEVRGVIPDVLVGMRPDDGDAFAARLIAARLPEAIDRAAALANSR